MNTAGHRTLPPLLAALALAWSASLTPAAAQDNPEARIKKLEAEVRALQRKVFPGGDGKYFEAEIARPIAAPAPPVLPATTSPATELLSRLDAVEASLARVTAQAEESGNRVAKLEARLAAFEAVAVPAAAPPAAGLAETPEPAAGPAPARSITGSVAGNTAAMAGTAALSPAARPTAERLAAVRAVEQPVGDDPGEDAYLYGYRLWEAKLFPEAQQQLKLTLDKYPRHPRTSYARNLLGRAYLDDGKPGTAAQVFLQNYQADKRGERAADSLLYLAVAMTRLKETQRACVALAELADTYPQEVAGRLATQHAAARAAVKCN